MTVTNDPNLNPNQPDPNQPDPNQPDTDKDKGKGKPGPLEPGGVRFQEIYARMKQAEADRDAFAARAEAANRDAANRAADVASGSTSRVGTEREVTVDDVLGAYEQGRISEVQKDRYLYIVSKRDAKREGMAEVKQHASATISAQRAQQEVDHYIKMVPSLRQVGSEEFQAVAAEYQVLLDEGYPDDIRTQRVAIKSALGPMSAIDSKSLSRDVGRSGHDTFYEGGGGGGGDRGSGRDNSDPLKDIPPQQIDYWKHMGYTREMMVGEAKYFTPKKAWGSFPGRDRRQT